MVHHASDVQALTDAKEQVKMCLKHFELSNFTMSEGLPYVIECMSLGILYKFVLIFYITIFQLATFKSRMTETEEKWKSAENNLQDCKASWEEQKRLHVEELNKLVSRCEELTSQNALLHEQGEKVLKYFVW